MDPVGFPSDRITSNFVSAAKERYKHNLKNKHPLEHRIVQYFLSSRATKGQNSSVFWVITRREVV